MDPSFSTARARSQSARVRSHTVNFSRIAIALPASDHRARDKGWAGAMASSAYRPFSAPAVKGMPGTRESGRGGEGLGGGPRKSSEAAKSGRVEGGDASPHAQRRLRSSSRTRPSSTRTTSPGLESTRQGTGRSTRGGDTTPHRDGDWSSTARLQAAENLYSRNQPRYHSTRAQSARMRPTDAVTLTHSPWRRDGRGVRSSPGDEGQMFGTYTTPPTRVGARVSQPQAATPEGAADDAELTAEERAFLLGEVGEG